ncbi:MAG: Asp23/Gls24 family envelope stress response protein [Lentisphaeria bacterium]|nr:Asp23/Gls24 family envelope stress response protein [Lentisphaeria bacterium]
MKNTADAAVEKKDVNVKNNDAMMLGDSELGDVKIHDGVIATLTRRAALAIEGVSRLAGNALVDNLAEIVGSRRMQARAITIAVNENNQITIEIKLNLKVGYTIPEVAENVQKAVIADVEKVTGMTVTTVHVLVQDIDDETSIDDEEDGDEI